MKNTKNELVPMYQALATLTEAYWCCAYEKPWKKDDYDRLANALLEENGVTDFYFMTPKSSGQKLVFWNPCHLFQETYRAHFTQGFTSLLKDHDNSYDEDTAELNDGIRLWDALRLMVVIPTLEPEAVEEPENAIN